MENGFKIASYKIKAMAIKCEIEIGLRKSGDSFSELNHKIQKLNDLAEECAREGGEANVDNKHDAPEVENGRSLQPDNSQSQSITAWGD